MQKIKGLLMADFTIDPLRVYLKDVLSGFDFAAEIAPYGQIRQVLQDSSHSCWQEDPDLCLIWTYPEKVSSAFARFLNQGQFDWQEIATEISQLARCMEGAASRCKMVFVPAWTQPSYQRGWGILDYRCGIGVRHTLLRMNLLLAEELQNSGNIYILDTERWMAAVSRVEDPKLWYLGKIPFTREFFILAAEEIGAAIRAVYGQTRKILVLDLDNTLWGGEIGDLGITGIRLGGTDPMGEAYVDFQKQILALKNRGILLAISSKNEESTALEAIDHHPEMVLRRNDFVSWRINWRDKAQNIVEMMAELNLGLQSVVFIDDNPTERGRVHMALPEVLTPDWPSDPLCFVTRLRQLTCFDTIAINREDLERTTYYLAEEKRKQYRHEVQSLEGWLSSLHLQVSYEELHPRNLARAVQLLNRTNQFNLMTRRMEQEEFARFATSADHRVLTFRVIDCFGDYGMVGLCSFILTDLELELQDFVLSCRAMGRGVEQTMLYVVKGFADKYLKVRLIGHYIPTDKNKPCQSFLTDNGFERQGDNYLHPNPATIPLPPYITLVAPEMGEESSNVENMRCHRHER